MDTNESIEIGDESRAAVDTARTIVALWSEVLDLPRPPTASEDFFALGGDSMSMVTLEFRVQEQLHVQLPPGSVLAAPTLREFMDLVDAHLGNCS